MFKLLAFASVTDSLASLYNTTAFASFAFYSSVAPPDDNLSTTGGDSSPIVPIDHVVPSRTWSLIPITRNTVPSSTWVSTGANSADKAFQEMPGFVDPAPCISKTDSWNQACSEFFLYLFGPRPSYVPSKRYPYRVGFPHTVHTSSWSNSAASLHKSLVATRWLSGVFEADLRGNGFDLCNPFQSSCSYTDPSPSCLYLYWSVTDDGQRGIIYSVDGSDLTETERDNPVSCDEATNIAWSD